MKLPGGDTAIADHVKLTEYCLNPGHPRGKHKARVFSSVLGITTDNAELLRTALLHAAATGDAEAIGSDKFGDRYVIDSMVTGPRGTATVRSTWIVRSGESRPRLTSCFVT
ncbi:MAG: DUF6883 domain-containing protein [Woeseia sp.]